jgi:hypothetical protein
MTEKNRTAVQAGIGPPRGQKAKRYAEEHREDGPEEGYAQGGLQARGHQPRNWVPADERRPQVAPEQVAHPPRELHEDRIVQSELVSKRLLLLSRRLLINDHANGVAGRDLHQEEGHSPHEEDDGHCRQKPPYEVLLHPSASSLGATPRSAKPRGAVKQAASTRST